MTILIEIDVPWKPYSSLSGRVGLIHFLYFFLNGLSPAGSSSKKEKKHQDPDVTPPYINGSVMDKNEGENEGYSRRIVVIGM